jgi:hypothetical protein
MEDLGGLEIDSATSLNIPSPDPSRTGAMSSQSSSMTPASSAWRTVEAPPAMSMPSAPAVSRAWA